MIMACLYIIQHISRKWYRKIIISQKMAAPQGAATSNLLISLISVFFLLPPNS